MTEAEWLAEDDPFPRQLSIIQTVASVRMMRLIAAVFVRGAQGRPECVDAKECADLIECVADRPRPRAEIEAELATLPGNWAFTHILYTEERDRTAMELRRLVSMHRSDAARSVPELIRLIHEVVGNPFRPGVFDPAWRTDTVLALASGMYEGRDFSPMPILADALQDAGCENEDVLNHCRDETATHVRGCWVVDLVLGKE